MLTYAHVCSRMQAEYSRLRKYIMEEQQGGGKLVQESVASSVVKTALDIDAELLLALSHTGATGDALSRARARSLTLALSLSISPLSVGAVAHRLQRRGTATLSYQPLS